MNEFLNAKHIIASVCLSLLIVSAFGRADNIMSSSEIGGYIISIIFIVYGVIIGQWAYKRYKDVVKNNTLRVILIILFHNSLLSFIYWNCISKRKTE